MGIPPHRRAIVWPGAPGRGPSAEAATAAGPAVRVAVTRWPGSKGTRVSVGSQNTERKPGVNPGAGIRAEEAFRTEGWDDRRDGEPAGVGLHPADLEHAFLAGHDPGDPHFVYLQTYSQQARVGHAKDRAGLVGADRIARVAEDLEDGPGRRGVDDSQVALHFDTADSHTAAANSDRATSISSGSRPPAQGLAPLAEATALPPQLLHELPLAVDVVGADRPPLAQPLQAPPGSWPGTSSVASTDSASNRACAIFLAAVARLEPVPPWSARGRRSLRPGRARQPGPGRGLWPAVAPPRPRRPP